ncbi:MAG: hypothetical protein RMJ19_12750 [Gemmatales bacterium]|nr:hypothetical protein [Gemmatales bacterium]MDW8176536.1 hypothetical protein [Gemmatales bacterium]
MWWWTGGALALMVRVAWLSTLPTAALVPIDSTESSQQTAPADSLDSASDSWSAQATTPQSERKILYHSDSVNWKYLVQPVLAQSQSLSMDNYLPLSRLVEGWQALLQAFACAGVTALAWQAFASRVLAGTALLLSAMQPLWLLRLSVVDDVALMQCLVSNWLLVVAHTARQGGVFGSILLGGLAGLILLIRPGTLLAVILVLVWSLWQLRQATRGWLASLIVVLALANFLGTWSVRHWWNTGEPTPFAAIFWQYQYAGLPSSAVRPQIASDFSWQEAAHAVTTAWRESLRECLAHRLTLWGQMLIPENWTDLLGDSSALGAQLDTYLPLVQLLLAVAVLLGWRWSFGWYREHRPITVVAFGFPLAYAWGTIAGVREGFSLAEPVFLLYAALGIAGAIPWLSKRLLPKQFLALPEAAP